MLSKTVQRFWERVDVRSPDECWPFLGSRFGGRDGKTYGQFAFPWTRTLYAHRFAFCVANDFDIDDLTKSDIIRHDCDNPICCNPSHLTHGSQAQNAQDMVLRGRSLRGELDPMAVLTEGQVHQIRHRLAAGEFHRTIAASYGVCRETVTMINLGRLWGWLKTEGLQGS